MDVQLATFGVQTLHYLKMKNKPESTTHFLGYFVVSIVAGD